MLKFAWGVFLLACLAGTRTLNIDEPLNPSEFTYVIFKDRFPVCAGTAVGLSLTSVYIVTGAHCVYKAGTSRLAVSLNNTIFDSQEVQNVDLTMVHPYYLPPSLDYDIALLKVKVKKNNSDVFSTVAPSAVKPLTLTKVQPTPSDTVDLIQWDFKTENSDGIRVQNASVEDRKSCQVKLGSLISVSSKMLCVNYQFDKVPDGGPLLFKEGIVGVASYKVKDNKGNLPKVFTNFANSEIYSFIEKYI